MGAIAVWLAACTVGKDGAAGPAGVPCNGCVTSQSLAPGAITTTVVGDGTIKSQNLAAKSVTTPAIADGAVGATQLASGAVGSTQLAAQAVSTANLADGAVGTTQIATGAVTGASIAPATITGANIDSRTDVTAAHFLYANPLGSIYFADPSLCQRTAPGGPAHTPPYQDVGTDDPTQNAFGPSISITNIAAGNYDFYCPVMLPIPVGATVNVVAASMIYFDPSNLCLVGAELRTKLIATSSIGNVPPGAAVFDGSNNADFAFIQPGSGPQTKGFPAFAAFQISPFTVFFVHAVISLNTGATGAQDCRYGGVVLTYTVDRP